MSMFNIVHRGYGEGTYPNGLKKEVIPKKGLVVKDFVKGVRLIRTDDYKSLKNLAQNTSSYKGRYVNSWCRLRTVNSCGTRISEGVCIDVHGKPFAKIYPNNTIEWVATQEEMWQYSTTLVSAFHRWFPFYILRYRKGLYKIAHQYPLYKQIVKYTNTLKKLPKRKLGEIKGTSIWSVIDRTHLQTSPMYFEGIKFNLTTGKCINPQTNRKFVEIPEKRKEWRKKAMAFKKGIKARIKVGSLDTYVSNMAKIKTQSRGYTYNIDWNAKAWINLLATCLGKGEYTKELLLAITYEITGGSSYFNSSANNQWLITRFEHWFKTLSIPLRKELGVFKSIGFEEWKDKPHGKLYELPSELTGLYNDYIQEANK